MKGVQFKCPDCEQEVKLEAALIASDHEVLFIGNCEICDQQVKFKIQTLLEQLLIANPEERRH